jgi:hypothetical protein
MYKCTCDYTKLVICANLPREPAEEILATFEKDMQKSARDKKNLMLQELVNNQRFIYLRLIHEVIDKYEHSANELYDSWNEENRSDPYNVSLHYIRSIAFDIKMYHADHWIGEDDKWRYYKQMVLCRKSKDSYIKYVRLMLNSLTNTM